MESAIERSGRLDWLGENGKVGRFEANWTEFSLVSRVSLFDLPPGATLPVGRIP